MRLHSEWIFGFVLILAAVVYGPMIWSNEKPLSESVVLPEAVRSRLTSDPAFVVQTDRWLDFGLPDEITATRLLTNACLGSSVRGLEDEEYLNREWNYRIRFEVRGRGNDLVESGVYHFRTKLDRCRDPQTGNVFSGRFFDPPAGDVAVTQEMVLDRESVAGTQRRLRLRLDSADPEITEVVVRASGRLERLDSQVMNTWERLSQDRRNQLASCSVYPEDLLTQQQQINLLRTVWSSLAPMGSPGRSYTQRTLFIVRDTDPFMVRESPEPAGFIVHKTLHGMLPVPMEPGLMQLEFQTIPRREASVPSVEYSAWPEVAELKWFGDRIHQRSTATIQFAGPGEHDNTGSDGHKAPTMTDAAIGSTTTAAFIAAMEPGGVGPDGSCHWKCELPTAGGLYELQSRVPLIVRALWRPLASSATAVVEAIDITPQPSHLRTYATTANQPVEFSVSHLAGYPTTVRISVRAAAGRARLIPTRDIPNSDQQQVDRNDLFIATEGVIPSIVYATVEWRLIDMHGDIIGTGLLTGESIWSVHERLTSDALTTQVSDPLDYFLNVPENVARLQLVTTGSPLLISMATRPPDVARVTAVPEDYSAYTRRETDNRSWFAVRPTEHTRLVETGQSLLLITQTRPPEDDPDRTAGRYLWEDFSPRGEWQARHVLTARDPTQPFSDESVLLAFHELPCNSDQQLRLLVNPGKRTIAPALVYLFADSQPSPMEIFVDGRLHHRVIPQSAAGEVTLPPWIVNSPVASVRIDCAVPVQLWMNHVDPQDGVSSVWTKRLAVELDRPSLEFTYRKLSSGPERLSVLVFRSLQNTNRTQLRVTIVPLVEPRPSTAATQFTLRERVFSFAPPKGPPALMLPAMQNSTCDTGQAGLIPLGDDLPAGEYLIRISRETQSETTDDPLFLIVSRTTPGEFDLRELSIEIVPEVKP